jgi:murein DD-endopeptidase MepM/ murein hydrolase activator NlpD
MVFFGSAIEEGDTIKKSLTLNEDDNVETKDRLVKYEKRLAGVEKNLVAVNNYNKYVYSQLIDLGIDTADFNVYNVNDVDFSTISNDSVFMHLNDKNLYASQLVSLQLSKLIKESEILEMDKIVLDAYPSISPIKSVNFNKIMSKYGWRMHPLYRIPLFHDGIDIKASPKAEIRATMDGIVVKIVKSKHGYGNRIDIGNSYGYETLYAHLSAMYVKKGDTIKKGQVIGVIGNSGSTTGIHLHYEIRKNDNLKDPLGYFYGYLTSDLIADKYENTH